MWFHLSNGNSWGCKLKRRWEMRPTYTTDYSVKYFRVTRRNRRLQILPRFLFFFFFVWQNFKGGSALWCSVWISTSRQGILQRLKSKPTSLPPSSPVIWQGLGSIRKRVSDLDWHTLPPHSIHAPTPPPNPMTLLPTRQNCMTILMWVNPPRIKYKPNTWWCSSAMKQETSTTTAGHFGPSAETLRCPTPPESTRNALTAVESDPGRAPCLAQRRQLWERCCTANGGRWSGVPALVIYSHLFWREHARLLPVLRSSIWHLPTVLA